MATTSVFLGNPVDRGAWQAGPWGHEELDTTDGLNAHACTGGKPSNSFQFSLLEELKPSIFHLTIVNLALHQQDFTFDIFITDMISL